MQPGESPPSPDPIVPKSRKGLFQRISSPFGTKSRTVVEFVVQADDPHRQYAPGDVVSGAVILKLARPVRVTHIVICLHGFVQVYKTPGAPPVDGFRAHNNLLGKGRGRRRGEYFGNGFATLFEDEQVVCGDGRLGEGNYKFQFEMRFPKETLPSSIDFERGTISYMMTATMTRPTSISPINYHDQKLSFAERIDISQLLPPQARKISLVALVRRMARPGNSRRKTAQTDSTKQGAGTLNSALRSNTSIADDDLISGPRSPSPSMQSCVSQQSSGDRTSVDAAVTSSRASASGSVLNAGSPARRASRDIVVTVESLRGGALPGEMAPVRILVNHTKHIKSMRGAIVTLYRHARVDTHPTLPLGPTTDGEKRKFEDYYPKSLTGLGGLSLSGAGSCHSFRKDLSQVVLPLIVDPTTLSAELNPKLRVPDDAFPTIACVPGAMISFRYYLEVILDIQGKLASVDRYLLGSQSSRRAAGTNGYPYGEDSGPQVASSGLPVDTTAFRRDKSVVVCVLEIVIGTQDSERKKGRDRAPADANTPTRSGFADPPAGGATAGLEGPEDHEPDLTTLPGQMHRDYAVHPPPPDHFQYNNHPDYYDDYDGHGDYAWEQDAEVYEFAPPHGAEEASSMTEKERLRRAELALLPSEPPEDAHEAAATTSFMQLAIAPQGELEQDWSDRRHVHTQGPQMDSSRAPRYSQVMEGSWFVGAHNGAEVAHDSEQSPASAALAVADAPHNGRFAIQPEFAHNSHQRLESATTTVAHAPGLGNVAIRPDSVHDSHERPAPATISVAHAPSDDRFATQPETDAAIPRATIETQASLAIQNGGNHAHAYSRHGAAEHDEDHDQHETLPQYGTARDRNADQIAGA